MHAGGPREGLTNASAPSTFVDAMARGSCEFCARPGATVHATFSRNIGMLIMRQTETVSGRHCARCLVQNFGRMQGLNMLLGWWGTISFVMTLFFSGSNVFHLVSGGAALWSDAASKASREAALTRHRESVDAGAELARFRHTIRMRLRRGETAGVIARDMVDAANVPLEKADAFVAEIARAEA